MNVKSCRDVCTLLRDDRTTDTYRSDEDYALLPSVIRWFDVLGNSVMEVQVDEPFVSGLGNCHAFSSYIIPDTLKLLRFCFLTCQDVHAATLLNLLAEMPHKVIDVIAKAGPELVYHNPTEFKNVLEQLISNLKCLGELNVKELMLEYLMFVLHQGEISEAKFVFSDVPKPKILPAVTAQSQQIDLLCKAYQGLVFYVDWLIAKNKAVRLQELGALTEEGVGFNFEEMMQFSSEKALACFESLRHSPGVWDIFITKEVEIHEFYGHTEKAEYVLHTYKEQNKENPNAHKYLHQFSVRHNQTSTSQIEILKGLAECVPSDPLVLNLCELLIEENEESVAVGYLFDLLDDVTWQKEIKPWSLLAHLSQNTHKQNVLTECMEYRHSWWPRYHFTVDNSQTWPSQLLLNKAICCLYLDKTTQGYIDWVKANLSSEDLIEFNQVEHALKGSDVT